MNSRVGRAHDGFLAIAAQHGGVGLLIVITAWTLVVRESVSMPSRDRFTILAVLLMAVMASNWEGNKSAWLLLALALVQARYARPWSGAAEAVGPELAPVGRSLRWS